MSVYFIRASGYFKIGFSDEPIRRFERLERSGTRYTFPADASFRLEDRQLYKVVDGWKDDERRIHLALDDFAVGLEWFLDEPLVREFIDDLSATSPHRPRKITRPDGFCAADWTRVQGARAEREMGRYYASRRSA